MAPAVRPLHTYSIVARDSDTGQMGAAMQSHWLPVGSVVLWGRAGTGIGGAMFEESVYDENGQIPSSSLMDYADGDGHAGHEGRPLRNPVAVHVLGGTSHSPPATGKGIPTEFRRRLLDLIAAGRKVADVARDLGVSDQTFYNWRKQDRIDRGLEPGLTSTELEELAKARRRIAELETELAAMKRSQELLKELVPPKGRFDVIAQMASEGHAVNVACGILGVSQSGFYAWRGRPPSARAIRHAWLTDLITQIYLESRRAYGANRVQCRAHPRPGRRRGPATPWPC